MNICVFCSASDVAPTYSGPAVELATLIARGRHGFVWGGSDEGLMKIMADAVQGEGGTIIGVSMEFLKHKARKNADEMIIAKDLGARKAALLARADALVVLVGGIGTLDEMAQVLELKKHGQHKKPIAVLNTENFYQGLQTQLKRMEEEGFLPETLDELVYFARTPQEVMRYIAEHGN